MNAALVMLNQIIDQGHVTVLPGAEDAREALRTIELFPLAAGALDTLLKHPGNKEGIAHAQRVVAHLQESERRASARRDTKAPPVPPLPPTSEAHPIRDEADLADLA